MVVPELLLIMNHVLVQINFLSPPGIALWTTCGLGSARVNTVSVESRGVIAFRSPPAV